jgi:membrane-associated protease RseP (regulator of RpoE activity)
MSGPLAGMLTSLCMLVVGLGLTLAVDVSEASNLPAFPVYILQSSALGGGLIELFLGKESISSLSENSVQSLHPAAIAGFIGLLTNALALLPIGRKYIIVH